ncbi:PTB domain-containing engulfment adapter protein 1 isoform X2 [Coccinella septempunctata]|uniref:PTB domain-containing engulfment adapter protein 1 isoform X2 n=1 Tax=Coccinella septempunctata TaxID=41139 RepID=UPI001D07EEC7|nr:PTB domain-containing engulfment adapter protein 1 isoform X2 [Coccinella septempunctata]
MGMSTLRKWAQNTQNKLNIKNNNTNGTNGERKWIHPPGTLQKGHIAYLVKFLGNIVVDQPKGIDVVKEAIRKLRFTQQLRKSESGAKTKKVELTISIDGVAIQEPKTHVILHMFPLHRISYCADDNGEKRFFSFIAKQTNQVDSDAEETHECFVFISDKLAEEITLTIGQAFELAYKRFLETSGKDLEAQRRAIITQQRIKRLELENNIYKMRLLFLSQLSSCKADLDQYLRKHEIKNILEIPPSNNNAKVTTEEVVNKVETNGKTDELLDLTSEVNRNGNAPPVPPRIFDSNPSPSVGTKLEGLLLNEFDQEDNDFDPRSFEQTNETLAPKAPLIAPPPKAPRKPNMNNNIIENNLPDVWSSPFTPESPSTNSLTSPKILDPFEMGDFGNTTTTQDIENALGLLDKKILEMKTGFSRGISFGNDDFSLESLDPLKN